MTAAGSRSISGRCTGEYKEHIYFGPQRRFGRTPLVSHLFQVSLMYENTLLTKTHLLLFIYNRNRLRRINFLSTECQQRLKNKNTIYNVSYNHKGKSLFYYLVLTLQHYSLCLTLQHYSLFPSLQHYSLFLTLQHFSLFFSLRESDVGRCTAVTWGVARQSRRGGCAAVARQYFVTLSRIIS